MSQIITNEKATPARLLPATERCHVCSEYPAVYRLTLTDANGVLHDSAKFCGSCATKSRIAGMLSVSTEQARETMRQFGL